MRQGDVVGDQKARGRPREFAYDEVVDKAIDTFSRRGYHGTSIHDLADATGLATGSLYKAFKDKREVFIAAFDSVRAARLDSFRKVCEGSGTGREKIRRILDAYVEVSQGDSGRRGCMVVGTAAELATFDPEIELKVARAFRQNEEVFEGLLRKGQMDGSIRPEADPGAAARTLNCMIQGMRVLGKTGRTQEEMNEIVEAAMRLF